MGTPILFSPDNVRNVLGQLPSVAPLLPDPAVEGKPSDAFPGVLGKTEREVYRWIANTHYDPKFDQAAVRWLERLAAERDTSLRDVRLAAVALEALRSKHHDLAEKMLLRFLS